MSSAFVPARAHGEITEVLPDLFVVRSSYRFMPGFSIPRNMIVVRQGEELTLVNGVRLGPEGEAALERLGRVKHLVRLGSFHGVDDPYLKARYQPRTWAAKGLEADEALGPGRSPVGEAWSFEGGQAPEAAMCVASTLLTCDSFQNWTSESFAQCSWLGRVFMRQAGFRPALIGPFWLKRMGPGVESDLRRLAEWSFEHAIAGHGEPIVGGAHGAYKDEVERTFRPTPS